MLLEQPRKSGSKVISHMLSSHGGEIFLHVLNSNRSTLEDPPSISEGCGGRVTDYRITVRSTHPICVALCVNNPEMLMIIIIFFVCFRTLVNLWGRTGSRLCLSLPMIPLGNYQLRGPKPSWNVTLDTGRWSSPRPPSSTCRQWVARRDTVVLLEDFYQSSESSIT